MATTLQQLLDTLTERCKEVGLIKAQGESGTDATSIRAAAQAMARLEVVTETLELANDISWVQAKRGV